MCWSLVVRNSSREVTFSPGVNFKKQERLLDFEGAECRA